MLLRVGHHHPFNGPTAARLARRRTHTAVCGRLRTDRLATSRVTHGTLAMASRTCVHATADGSFFTACRWHDARQLRVEWYRRQLSSTHMSLCDVPELLTTLADKDHGWQLLCAAVLEDENACTSSAILDSAACLSARNKVNALVYLVDNIGDNDSAGLVRVMEVLVAGAVSSTHVHERQVRDALFYLLSRPLRGSEFANPVTPTLNSSYVPHLVRRVLSLPAEDLAACVGADGEPIDRCAVRVAERCVSPSQLVNLYSECCLPFETAAYRSQPDRLEEPPRIRCGKGFGDAVCVVLSRGAHSHASSPAVIAQMPPRLARFTQELLSLANARQLRECGQSTLGNTPIASLASEEDAERAAKAVTPQTLKHLSDVHFRYLCGTQHTAKALLPECSTRGQVAAVMAYTHDAGLSTAFAAAASLLRIRPSDTLFISLRLSHSGPAGGRHPHRQQPFPSVFVFEAKAEPLIAADAPRSHCASAGVDAASSDLGGKDVFAMDTLWRAFSTAGVFPFPVSSSRPERPADDALASLAEGHVSSLLASMPRLRTSYLSSWGSLLIRRGNLPAARTLFLSAAQRHLAPDMETIVEFLEAHHRTDPRTVQEAAQLVQTHWPDIAPNAFRAFMERLSTTEASRTDGRLDAVAALRLLTYASDNELHHLPLACVHAVAGGRRGQDVRALLDALSAPSLPVRSSGGKSRTLLSSSTSPRQLCLSAIERLTETTQELGLRPQVDFFSYSSSSKDVVWWSSRDRASGKPATQRLYETGTWALWRLSAHELHWATLRTPTLVAKALRLVCLGCSDAQRIIATLNTGLDLLAAPAGHRRRHDEEAALLAPTLVCASEALCAVGEHKLALSLLPPDSEESLVVLRLARLRALTDGSTDSTSTHNHHLVEDALKRVRRVHRRPRCRGRQYRASCTLSQRGSVPRTLLSTIGVPRRLQRLMSASSHGTGLVDCLNSATRRSTVRRSRREP